MSTLNLLAVLFASVFAAPMAAPGSTEAAIPSAGNDLRLCPLFSDHMVLQRECDASVWGRAWPNENVRIHPSWSKEETLVRADTQGHWRTKLHTPKAGGPHTISFQASRSVKLEDVWIGEVWLASGQSNMEMPLMDCGALYTGVQDAEKEIAAAKWPRLRMFDVPNRASATAQDELVGTWSVCSPDTAGGFSAVAYFFARELLEKLNVPVGIVNASWGGTPIEAWMSAESLAAFPHAAAGLKKLAENAASKDPKKAAPEQDAPSALFNGMIAPLVPFALRGAIWYQGESNRGDGLIYAKIMSAMIGDWRTRWGVGEFPFYFVQIAPHRYRGDTGMTALLREGQLHTLEVPATGMAVTMDIGDKDDIHPKRKQEVGRRLALWALAKIHGQDTLEYSGPLYRAMKVEEGAIRIQFDHAQGLKARGGEAGPFLIAGADHKFVAAEAKIENDTVVVSAAEVREPLAVRYAWLDFCEPTLFNAAYLPASPFRTDTW